MAISPHLEADARPTKSFFIDNLTRDLPLEDAILDLVDNAIDAFIRTKNLDVSPALLSQSGTSDPPVLIKLSFTAKEFRIEDKCGGMDLDHAKQQVFRFGRPPGAYESVLGVFGIGLKRAIFKIGQQIEIVSRTTESGFRVVINVPEWSSDDSGWAFPLESISKVEKPSDAGTTITIRDLMPEVCLRLSDGTLLKRLTDFIASTYSFFLSNHLGVVVNGVPVKPQTLPLAETALLPSNSRSMEIDEVKVSLIAGLQQRHGGEWNAERAGWYVLCNGRVVVNADKTDLTGWGLGGPTFVSKHRGFLGIAFFFSSNPAKLPWTTTKRGLNRDSAVYQLVRKEMSALARPVLSFLASFYPRDSDETKPARDSVADLQPANLGQVVERSQQNFPSVVPNRRSKRTIVSVQFDAERADIDRVKKKISKPSWGAGTIGRFTFEHYLKTECPE